MDKITEFYFGNLANMNKQNIHKLISMRTDATFAYSVHDFVTRHLPHARNNSVFQYLYSHEGKNIFRVFGESLTFSDAIKFYKVRYEAMY